MMSPFQQRVNTWRLRQLTTPLWTTPAEVCRGLFGVQAQENGVALVAIWNRLPSGSFTFDDPHSTSDTACLRRSELDETDVAKLWGQRRTVHAYCTEHWPVIASIMSQQLLTQADERLSTSCSHSVHLTLSTAIARLATNPSEEIHIPSTVFRHTSEPEWCRLSTLMHLTLDGHGAGRLDNQRGVVPLGRSHIAPSLASHWPVIPRPEALEVAARTYISSYGPCTEQDVRYWLGIKAGDSKTAIQRILDAGVISVLSDEDAKQTKPADQLYILSEHMDLFQALANTMPTSANPHVRLLARYDPLVLAHRDKSWLIEEAYRPRVWDVAARVHGVILVNGRIRGICSYKLNPNKLTMDMTLSVFTELGELGSVVVERARRQAMGIAVFHGAELAGFIVDEWSPKISNKRARNFIESE